MAKLPTVRERRARARQNLRVLLPMFQRRFLGGYRMALWNALDACAACGAPLPDWAADEFRAGIATMRQYRSRSWSEVFGEPYQGKHLDSLRLRRLKWEVWHIARAVTAGKKPKKPRDEQTFGEVGRAVSKKFGVRMRATTARELFYEAEREVADLWATLDAPPRG